MFTESYSVWFEIEKEVENKVIFKGLSLLALRGVFRTLSNNYNGT